MNRLNNKVALITGGTSGIGLSTTEIFLAEGAKVTATGRSESGVAQAQLSQTSTNCRFVTSDSSNLGAIDQLMADIQETHGHLDILVLNAAIAKPAPLEGVSEANFDETVGINLKGVFFAIQKALPLMPAGSSIVITTSITNQLGSPNFSVYAACKAALRSLVASLALELIPRGIRLNAVSPGPITTPMFDRFGLPKEAAEAIKSEIAGKSPIRRFGTPEEIAKTILFLASDDASYIVGEEIVVDGGMSLL